ncbi:MAG: hypothetical protein AB7N76_09815 [Planctomycetota bacterium]
MTAVLTLVGVAACGLAIPGELPVWLLLGPLILFVTAPAALVHRGGARASRWALALSPLIAFGASHLWVGVSSLCFAAEVERVSAAAWNLQGNEANRIPTRLSRSEVVVYRWLPGRGGRLGLLRDGEVDAIVEVARVGGELVVVDVDPVRFMSSGSSMVWPNR